MFSRRENNTQRVAALDTRAEELSLKPGMGIAEARAMHPGLEVVEADPAADRRLLESLADWCDRYTPLVALDGEDGLFLDITGCAHLFGGERSLMDDLLARFFHQGFDARAGLASTPGTAWAAARFGGTAVVASGEEEDLLAPLPLAALRLDGQVRTGLESVGLRTAGALMTAPRAPLVRRFGRQVVLRLDQALGRVEEAISPRLPVASLSAERALAEPIGLLDDIEALIALLATRLRIDLERRGEGAERLQLSLFRVDGAVSRIGVATSRPVRESRLIQKLFHERLTALQSEMDVGYGFDLLRLCVLAAARVDPVQADLHGETADQTGDLALFTDRVRARLGDRAIHATRLVESHLPERAAVQEPFQALPADLAGSDRRNGGAPDGLFPGAPATAPAAPMQERPVRLFEMPQCVEVEHANAPRGSPLGHFRWRRSSYRVARAEGPERIAPEWWRDAEQTEPRDYYRVEDDEGRRYWLFRQVRLDEEKREPRWYLHGVFA